MVCELTSKDCIDSLVEIWEQAFGDSREYIKMFMQADLSGRRIICYEADNISESMNESDNFHIPISVAYLLKATFCQSDREPMDIYYLYAAATHKDYRGCGYFTKILEWMWKNIKEPVILVPANLELKKYYEKHGMKSWLNGQKKVYLPDLVNLSSEIQLKAAMSSATSVISMKSTTSITTNTTITAITALEYGVLREKYHIDTGYVCWDLKSLKYILQENEYCGGICRKIVMNDIEMAVIARKEGSRLVIIELLAPLDMQEKCVSYLLEIFACESAELCIQPDVVASHNFEVSRDTGYFNLTLG